MMTYSMLVDHHPIKTCTINCFHPARGGCQRLLKFNSIWWCGTDWLDSWTRISDSGPQLADPDSYSYMRATVPSLPLLRRSWLHHGNQGCRTWTSPHLTATSPSQCRNW